MSRDNGLVLPISLTTDERQFLVLATAVITLIVVQAERRELGITNSEADGRREALVKEFVDVAQRVDHISLMRRLS